VGALPPLGVCEIVVSLSLHFAFCLVLESKLRCLAALPADPPYPPAMSDDDISDETFDVSEHESSSALKHAWPYRSVLPCKVRDSYTLALHVGTDLRFRR
jgi:hypothetical protein